MNRRTFIKNSSLAAGAIYVPDRLRNVRFDEVILGSNPNIFKKLVPEYNSILSFTDTPTNSYLLHCDGDYRIY